MAKSTALTYILWLVGGWWGAHLVYLRRYRHALVWYCTAGGCCGIGLLRDICRIPDYVDDANASPEYVEGLRHYMRWTRKPPFSLLRFLGELLLGYLFGVLVKVTLPEEYFGGPDSPYLKMLDVLVPWGVAIGVHLIANIGHECVSFKVCVLTAYCTLPLLLADTVFLVYSVLITVAVINMKWVTWRPLSSEPADDCCRVLYKLFILWLCCALYTGLWFSALANNAYITTRDEEKIKLRDALGNFFKSPAWEEWKNTGDKIKQRFMNEGFGEAWEELVIALDPEGETHAYKVLNIGTDATEKDISSAYRRLSRVWHPDKHKDPRMKEIAQEKFMEIQQAYETLSTIKSRRVKKKKVPTATLR